MGFNSVILIANVDLHRIGDDEQFGAKVSEQLGLHCTGRNSPWLTDGFKVVAQHHANNVSVILVGGNTAKIIGMSRRGDGSWARDGEEGQQDVVRILKEVAQDHGYRLVKMTDAQKANKPWAKPYDGNGWAM
jgi:hypothetical protein